MLKTFKNLLYNVLSKNEFNFLEQNVIELNNFNELKKIFKWRNDPILDRKDIYDFEYIEDANERRIRDAESLATVMANVKPKIALEIGTSTGLATVLMSINSPSSKIYTINISPEEIESGKGGNLTTITLDKNNIGIEYKKRNLTNITQIYANTATWNPNIGMIDLAFIDGCHDSKFVFNDTVKILKNMKPGGFILWHDFNIKLYKNYDWVNNVCTGIDKLYQKKYLTRKIFHIRDSWTGIYCV